ncbi:hypothetical protein [uncultured Methanobrevibacter sp.]|uniref:hypothetical protein n=1 Tax=uncultured Methanobrevibacter sp. TaxID=253161 RepID=UPI00258E0C1E|nr:hypothetical protein [uncultured Methanobrevibacter sp.]
MDLRQKAEQRVEFLVMFFWGLDVLDKFFKAYSIRDYREDMIEKELSRMGE